MKRKFLIVFLAIICAVCCAALFAACAVDDSNGKDGATNQTQQGGTGSSGGTDSGTGSSGGTGGNTQKPATHVHS